MTITQTVEIPANRRLTIDVPRDVPVGQAILTFAPAPRTPQMATEAAANITHECPICAKHLDPETGNPRYNAETVAAIEEGMAVSRGDIPAKRFSSLAEMLEDLDSDDPDD